MKVSIIIPVYNMQTYLQECLDSVVNQTYNNIEIICVDDGSSDGSLSILEDYEKKDNRIVVIHKENGGQSTARNKGIEYAAGEFLYFMDSDDMLVKDAIETMVSTMQRNQLDLLYFSGESFFDDEKLEDKFSSYKTCYLRKTAINTIMTGEKMFAQLQENRAFLASPCLQCVRKNLLIKNDIKFYEGIIYEDELYTFLVCLEAKNAMCIEKTLFLRRVRENSTVTSSVTARNFNGRFITFKETLLKVAEHKTEDNDVKNALADRINQLFSSSATAYKMLSVKERRNVLANEDAFTKTLFDLYNYNRFVTIHKNEFKKSSDVTNRANESEDIKRLKNELIAVTSSKTYRIGLAVTYIPRKLLGGYQCCKDHGVIYTIILAIKKILNLPWINNFFLTKILRYMIRKIKGGWQCIKDHGFVYTIKLACKKIATCANRLEKMISNDDKQQVISRNELISIVMPVYNTEQFIEQCINSILNQTYQNIELICVDDGSTDGAIQILEKYREKDSRVQIIRQHNLYAGMARNKGLEVARGEYIVFLDSDDFFEKDFIESMYQSAITYDSDVVICKGDVYDNQNSIFRDAPWFLNLSYLNGNECIETKDYYHCIFNFTNPATWNKMFKRTLIVESCSSFPPFACANDISFTLFTIAMSKYISIVDKVLVHYRRNILTSISAKRDKEVGIFYEAYQLLQTNLIRQGLYNKCKRSFINLVTSGYFYEYNACNSEMSKQIVQNYLQNEYKYYFDLLNITKQDFYSYNNYIKMKELLDRNIVEQRDVINYYFTIVCTIKKDSGNITNFVETLLAQTFKDYNIVFIISKNNKVLSNLEKYRSENENVEIIVNDDSNQVKNEIINHCKGKYIQFLNSDAIVSKDYLHQVHKKLNMCDMDICSCKIECDNSIEYHNKNKSMYFINHMIDCSNLMFRTDYLRENHIYFKYKKYSTVFLTLSAFINTQKALYLNDEIISIKRNVTEEINTFTKNDLRDYLRNLHLVQMNLIKSKRFEDAKDSWNEVVEFIFDKVLDENCKKDNSEIVNYYLCEFRK